MAERETRAQIDRALELGKRLILAAVQPQSPAHGPMRRRVVIIGDEALARRRQSAGNVFLAVAPVLESALPMSEGEAGIGARKSRVELQRHLEEATRRLSPG
jgi:hypothetical protein